MESLQRTGSKIALSIILIISALYSFGQSKAKLQGTVVNAATKEPIDYASVSLVDPHSGKPVNGAVTDAKGNFSLTGIAPGTYQLLVEFIGFNPTTQKNVVVGSGTIKLGTLSLSPSSASLQAVTVTGSRPLVENHIDKMVFNAANDVTSQSGVALDVLKKVPSVSVDIDGNVELEGNPNIRFLINGKPSTIFGSSLADALQSIPASQIKSIEVITSPGAKYDAAGTGGIINIILKDNRIQGIHGTINASAGTRLENGSFNLGVRKDNIGVNAFFSGNEQLNTTTINTTDRQSFNPTKDTLTGLLQTGSSLFKRSGYQSGLSAEWDVTPRDKLTASFNYNHFGNHSSGITNQLQQVTDGSGNSLSALPSVRNAGSQSSSNSSDYSLDYKKNFKNNKDRELDVLITTSVGKNISDYYQEQDYPAGGATTSGSRGHNPGTDKETDFSVDYTQPLSEGFTLETGAKGVFEQLSNNIATDTLLTDKTYSPNANQSYGFIYSRQIYAYYLSSSFTIFHHFLEGKAGARYEYTHTTADFPGTNIPGYGLFVPSLVFQHKFDETQSIKAAYSYRIERPDYGDLNPFYNISDPHNISTGTPSLKPEKGHRYELGYNKSFGNSANLYIAAIYRYNTDDLQTFATYYPTLDVNGTTYTDVSLTQRYNIGSQTSFGGNIFGSLPVTSALSLRLNAQFGTRTNKSPGLATVSGFAVRTNLNASYRFGNDLVAEVFGNYNSSQKNIQGTRPAFIFYTLAVRKEFFHKKASLGFTTTNPFNKYVNQKTTLFGTNFSQYNLRQVPYQSFGITLSFKFGKLEFKEKEKERDNDNGPTPIEQPAQ
jgi:outer membrane receptor protein involved in Fe transport